MLARMNTIELTIMDLARIVGISTRTLRYYDQINLLKPARINASGYRFYGEEEVNRLQLIMHYRAMDMKLDRIKTLLDDSSSDRLTILEEQHRELSQRRLKIEKIIRSVEKSIEEAKGERTMNIDEKFEAFKDKMIADNEAKYGKEARRRYGEDAIDKGNKQFKYISKEQYREFEALCARQMETLKAAMEEGDPSSRLAMEAARLHREFLEFWWHWYRPEAHSGIVKMYLQDDGFKKHYDDKKAGAAQFLHDAVHVYLKKEFDFQPR